MWSDRSSCMQLQTDVHNHGHMKAHAHVQIHTCTNRQSHSHINTHTHTHTHTQTHTHMHIHAYTHLHTPYTCTHAHMRACTRRCINTDTHTHILHKHVMDQLTYYDSRLSECLFLETPSYIDRKSMSQCRCKWPEQHSCYRWDSDIRYGLQKIWDMFKIQISAKYEKTKRSTMQHYNLVTVRW